MNDMGPWTAPSTDLEPGDRFEVFAAPDGRTLRLPPGFADLDLSLAELISPQGARLTVHTADTQGTIGLEPALNGNGASLSYWLEYQAPGRFRLQPTEPPRQDAAELPT